MKRELKAKLEKGVSADTLKAMGACSEQVKLFERTFGSGTVKWTATNYQKAKNVGLSVEWLMFRERGLPEKAVRLINARWISKETVTIRANLRCSPRHPVVVPSMKEFAGKKAHVTQVAMGFPCTTYNLDVDGGEWNWADWMFTKPAPKKLTWVIQKPKAKRAARRRA